ncbi:MAG: hypothetical protein MRERV_89c001 [Mycoplasmataceae bacterium RV_VA103A]|nr:MAG: hypothetical protein MRERV_89c001 [Mycoplasmataceae bacterium RV_VA103A]
MLLSSIFNLKKHYYLFLTHGKIFLFIFSLRKTFYLFFFFWKYIFFL